LGACDAPWTCGPARVCAGDADASPPDVAEEATVTDAVADAPPAVDATGAPDASVADGPADASVDAPPADLPPAMDAPVAMDAPAAMDAPDACAAPRAQCADRCVDLATSSLHCGACGNACPVAQQCAGGRCVPCGALGQALCAAGGCLSGLSACVGVCRDTTSDGQHCGACGRACAMGMRCEAGACRSAGVVFVTAGGTFARAADGSLRAWGTNSGGQLGDGTTTARAAPSPTMAPMTAEEIVGGNVHTCARLADGTVSCWGTNSGGQLGVGPTASTPRPTPAAVPGLSGVVSIAAGPLHTCAVRGDGAVVCWGTNTTMQLGTGDTAARPTPTPVAGLSGTFVAVTAGLNHTCARRADGAVFCWGLNSSGQLGNGSTSGTTVGTGPSMVPGITAVEVSAGYLNTCARLGDGSVRCWGQNNFGQIGDGTTTNRPTPTAVRLPAPALELRVGAAFVCARLMTQAVHCWGYNTNGALGDGTTANRPTPAPVAGLTDATALAVSNSSHACARQAIGALRCWGYNRLGQVGDGSSVNRLTPVVVPGL